MIQEEEEEEGGAVVLQGETPLHLSHLHPKMKNP